MELRDKIDYNQLVKLANQLSKKDIELLINTLQAKISFGSASVNMKDLILNAPTWDDSDYSDYQRARTHMNNSRIS